MYIKKVQAQGVYKHSPFIKYNNKTRSIINIYKPDKLKKIKNKKKISQIKPMLCVNV